MSIKILLIGESSVGKTCLIKRYMDGTFKENFVTTVGMDYKVKRITLNNKQYDLEIIDTSGQERFHCLAESNYKKADGIMLVFDFTNQSSFDSLKDYWLNELDKYGNMPKIIVGNKKDLENIRIVNTQEMEKLGKKKNIRCFECSAKNGENIESIFIYLTELILSAPHKKRIKSFKLKNNTSQQNNNKNNKNEKTYCVENKNCM